MFINTWKNQLSQVWDTNAQFENQSMPASANISKAHFKNMQLWLLVKTPKPLPISSHLQRKMVALIISGLFSHCSLP